MTGPKDPFPGDVGNASADLPPGLASVVFVPAGPAQIYLECHLNRQARGYWQNRRKPHIARPA